MTKVTRRTPSPSGLTLMMITRLDFTSHITVTSNIAPAPKNNVVIAH